MSTPTVGDLTSVAGLAIAVALIVQLVLNVWAPPAATMDRFGPLIAVVVGIVLSVVATFTIGTHSSQDVFQAVLNGVFAGAAAMGIQNVTVHTAGLGSTSG